MTPRVTADNPTGVATFDHGHLVQLPEYAAACKALDVLGQAMRRADIELGPAQWLDVVREMAAALPYADACAECSGSVPTPAPHAGVVTDGRLDGDYRCPSCGSTWTRRYELRLPELIE
jgi:hypothetical protein